ncbi:putative oxidoreductase DltE [Colletotrichum liriopes]|uniref:Oxidoreductase DltE n=1 Tax=Colletotrichum liriopes TaxID=708192 RepID=A0AA37GYF8_9PEZI|nr:putative oxidoreductase DltE [Colletotrichum liriopes]
MPFPYKTALITGATSGIGHALAERLIENDVFVVAVGRRTDRLEQLLSKYGQSKVAVEAHDVSDLDGMEGWIKKITTKYPAVDCVILNAGVQNSFNFTPDLLKTANQELATNYLSPLHAITHFLPHLKSLSTPSSIVLVTSGLALVPMPRCANYCASKAALRSVAWSLRAQLADDPDSGRIRVIEVVPPAVQTELHTRQADLVKAGHANIGIPLEQFIDETWTELEKSEAEEIIVGPAKHYARGEVERKKAFDGLLAALKGQ